MKPAVGRVTLVMRSSRWYKLHVDFGFCLVFGPKYTIVSIGLIKDGLSTKKKIKILCTAGL